MYSSFVLRSLRSLNIRLPMSIVGSFLTTLRKELCTHHLCNSNEGMSVSPAQRETTHPFLQPDGAVAYGDRLATGPPPLLDNSLNGDVVFEAFVAASSLTSASTPLWLESQAGALQMAFSLPSSSCTTPQAEVSAQLPSSSYEETICYLESTSTDSCSTSPKHWCRDSKGPSRSSSRTTLSQPPSLQEHIAAEVIQEMFRKRQQCGRLQGMTIVRHVSTLVEE